MAKMVFDEFHVTLYVASHVDESESASMRDAIDSRAFRRALHNVVRKAVRRFPPLSKINVRVSR